MRAGWHISASFLAVIATKMEAHAEDVGEVLERSGTTLELAASTVKDGAFAKDAWEKLGKRLGNAGKVLTLIQANQQGNLSAEAGKMLVTSGIAVGLGAGAGGALAIGGLVDVTYDQLHYQFVELPHLFDEEDARRAAQERNEDQRRAQYFAQTQSFKTSKDFSIYKSKTFEKVEETPSLSATGKWSLIFDENPSASEVCSVDLDEIHWQQAIAQQMAMQPNQFIECNQTPAVKFNGNEVVSVQQCAIYYAEGNQRVLSSKGRYIVSAQKESDSLIRGMAMMEGTQPGVFRYEKCP